MNRLEKVRENLPEMARDLTRSVVDNPFDFALVASWVVVSDRLAYRLVRPRGFGMTLATALLVYVGQMYVVKLAADKGVLQFRSRGEDGKLPPRRAWGVSDADSADSPA